MIEENIASSAPNMEQTLKKLQRGIQIMLDGAQAETGQTPKEVIWTKNKAKLYHYLPMRDVFGFPSCLFMHSLIGHMSWI